MSFDTRFGQGRKLAKRHAELARATRAIGTLVVSLVLAGCNVGMFGVGIDRAPQGGPCPDGSTTCSQGNGNGTGGTPAPPTPTFTSTPPAQTSYRIEISPAPGTLPNNQCHSGFIVRTFVNNVQSNPNGATLNLLVPPGDTHPVQFVTGSACTPGGNTLQLAAGVSEGFVSIRAPLGVEGMRSLRVRDASGPFGELVVPVMFTPSGTEPPSEATSIRLVGPGEADAGSCAAISVNAFNGTVPAVLAAPLMVNLSFTPGDPPGTPADDVTSFYRNAGCMDADRTTTAVIVAQSSNTTVWFSTKRAVRYDLTGIAGVMQSTIAHFVRPNLAGPRSVRVSSLAGSTTAGRCIPGIASFTDMYGNPIATTTQATIGLPIGGLSPVTHPAIYTDPSCAVAAANRTLQVAPGQTGAPFFFRVDVARGEPGYLIEPVAAGYDPVPQSIVVLPANAAQLVIESEPPNIDAEYAGSLVRLRVILQDMYGNHTRNATNGNMTIQIAFERDLASPDPSDLTRAWLCPGWECPEPRPAGGRGTITVPIIAGGDNALFSMVLYDAGTVTVRATKTFPVLPAVAEGRFAVPPPFVVLPGDPAIVRVLPPAPGQANPRAGECRRVDYEFRDAYDNLTAARDNTPIRVVFEEYERNVVPKISLRPDCLEPISPPDASQPNVFHVTALPNTQGGTFYVTHTIAEDFTVTVGGPNAVPPISDSRPPTILTFRPNEPRRLVFLAESAGRSRQAECSMGIVVAAQDQYGNESAPTSALNVNLVQFSTSVPGAVLDFFERDDCTGAGASFSLVGSARRTFYVRSSVASDFRIEARVTNAGWPFAGFPFPLHPFRVEPNTALQSLPVALDFFSPTGALANFRVRAGERLGPLVLRPLNRAGNVVASDQTATITLRGRTTVERSPATDLVFYEATTSTCSNTPIPSGRVTLRGGQQESQAFCVSAERARALELVPDSRPTPESPALFVGVRLGFLVVPTDVSQFRFVSRAPAVGRCSLMVLETRDRFQNFASIISELEDPNLETGAIVEVTSLTQGAEIFSDRSCYDRIATGELTFPTGTTRLGFYLLSNAVVSGVPQNVQLSARTVEPNRGVTAQATVVMGSGIPSHRTMYLEGIADNGDYSVNVCHNAALKLAQQNNQSTDPTQWGVVQFPASSEVQVSFGTGSGQVFLGPNCSTGGAQTVSRTFQRGERGELVFSWRSGSVGQASIHASAIYAGRLLTTRANVTMNAADGCTNGATRTDRVVHPLGGAYWVALYRVERCEFGRWVLVNVYAGRLNDGCFPPEAQIAVAGGLPKRADLVRAGDELWNPVTRRPAKVLRVVKGPEQEGLVEIVAGKRRSKVSADHPMVTRRGLKAARDVVRGDELRLADGSFAKVRTVRQLAPKEGQMVYNFVLDVGEGASYEERLIEADGFVTGEWTLQRALQRNREAAKGELP
jgi:hypothetical protein